MVSKNNKLIYLVYRQYDALENRPYVDKIFTTKDNAQRYVNKQDNPKIFWIDEMTLYDQ